MANTYIQIGSTVTVGSGGASSVDFTSIPATYTDLVLKISGRTAASQGVAEVSFNGLTTNLSSRILYTYGTSSGSIGSATYASSIRAGYIVGTDYTASTFANNEIYISNYAGSNNKAVSIDSVGENNASEAYSSFNAGLWASSSAITSIKLTVLNNGTGAASTFVENTTVSLYGIKSS
jgi:hypothetical protein